MHVVDEKNYRPVSNLSFISKLIEKAVSSQLKTYLDTNNLNEPFQSAYRKGHSTETALLRVKNDIMMAVDQKKAVILVLLDLSAAFDTIDHEVLFARLKYHLGVSGVVLNWFKSYLDNRSQSVSIDKVTSDRLHLRYGVPQGSVLGPLLFVAYTLPLGSIARSHGVNIHMYADDTQLYVSLDVNDQDAMDTNIHKLETCIENIRTWMSSNKLKLNDEKTDIILVSTPYHKLIGDQITIRIGDSTISPSKCTRNLGVQFDRFMNMEGQISSICKSCYAQLHSIKKIKSLLTPEAMRIVVHSFITSRIDYCNSLLIGLPHQQIQRLQRIQNIAARIISGADKYDHITPVLQALHWLPVQERIQFKILLLTYRALNGLAPGYLSDLVIPRSNPRTLRSSSRMVLCVPKSRLHSYGDAAFGAAAAHLWNSLPREVTEAASIGQFKITLKTYLFKQAFKCN